MEIPVGFTQTNCASCSIPYFVPDAFIKRRKEDKDTFYCPSGHLNIFGGKTEADRLRELLTASQECNTRLANDLIAAKKPKRKPRTPKKN